MKLTYLGTAGSEGWPALFCSCESCRRAAALGGVNLRTRSQALIDETILIDFPPDTCCHVQRGGLNLKAVRTLLITHSHCDHFYPKDLGMRTSQYAEGTTGSILHVYGNDTVRALFERDTEEFVGLENYVKFHEVEAFVPFVTQNGYRIVPLKADHHAPEKSLMYWVEKEGRRILYAHDTGIFPEETWQYIAGTRFDLISLDCTGLTRDWRSGHLGFVAVDEVAARLRSIGCADADTRILLSHFAHCEDMVHEDICRIASPKGYAAAYDGLICSI